MKTYRYADCVLYQHGITKAWIAELDDETYVCRESSVRRLREKLKQMKLAGAWPFDNK